MNDNSGSGALAAFTGVTILVSLLIMVAGIVFAIIIYWKIFSKAGYSGALGLLMFVPIANIVVLCILAFGEWPIYRELNQLRQMAAGRYAQNPQNPQYPQYPQG
ncbi:MAG: hypothetical protein ACJ788_00275 [Ktedonobacteraceae bacterium]|jgi:uncharacterized membrane protein